MADRVTEEAAAAEEGVVGVAAQVVVAPAPPRAGYYPISHTSLHSRLWRLFIAITAIFISWAIPFFVGFVHDYSFNWGVIDGVVSALLLADLVFSFCTSYVDEETDNVIVDGERIVWNHGVWLIIDPISVIPYYFITQVIPYPSLAKLLLLLRVLKIRKTFIAISKLINEDNHKVVIIFLRWFKVLLATLVTLHIMACGFFFLARDNPDEQKTWLSLQAEKTTWFRYIVSFYWSTTSFSTVGYGDLHPVSASEMVFTVICILFGTGLMHYLSVDLNKLVSGDDRPRHLMDYAKVLRRFGSTTTTLSVDLKKTMVKYLTRDVSTSPPFKIRQLFPKLIQRELYETWISPIIRDLYFFQGVSDAFLFQMMTEMKIEEVEADIAIALVNELPDKLFIVLDGNLLWEETIYHSRICGELGVLGNLPQPFTIRPTRRSSVLSLDRTTFLKLLEVNREDGVVLLRNVLEFLRGQVDPALRLFQDRFEERLNWGKTDIPVSIGFALRRRHPGLLLHLIKSGDNFDYLYHNGQNILHIAVIDPVIEPSIIGTLLTHCPHLHTRDRWDRVPLCYAIEHRSSEFRPDRNISRGEGVIKQFSRAGVTIPQDKVKGYCYQAVQNRNLTLLRLVGEFGGDVNMVIGNDGETPLHQSVRKNDIEAVKILLKFGANPDQRNGEGRTPRTLAAERGNAAILALLGVF